MRLIKNHIIIRLISLVLLPLIWFYPSSIALAETAPTTSSTSSTAPTSTTSTTNKSSTTGPTKPTGADANKYTYNKTTGLWENAHYTWDPATNQTAPKDSPTYSYNPATGNWDTTKWRYDAPSGQYVPNTPVTNQSSTNTNNPINSPSSDAIGVNNTVKTNSNVDDTYNLFYNAKISNVIGSTSTTGEAIVAQNTVAGSALSGNAQAMTNIINMLQSYWSLNGGQPATFINNVNGDVYGDLVIDPTLMPTNLSTSQSQNANLNMNVQNSGQINNQINLAAASGNATVDKNTSAGNATTGSAQAIADIVNMINSSIAGGQSFLGMININGNFNGDILMPADMINQLLASNNVPKTTIDTSKSANGSLLADFTNNATINNQVKTQANSGDATVNNNTLAGNATTGNASTNLTVLNLTGQEIIGKDALMVFVNVQGQWIGMIVNAPGSTSALLGGGITSDKSTSTNSNIDATNNFEINNDVTASATSGNAAVTNNTKAGNATSGNATASINLANILNSSFSLSNWFGILFINITGNWTGSFGINTAAGNPKINNTHNTSRVAPVFGFVPHDQNEASSTPVTAYAGSAYGGNSNNDTSVVLASSKNKILAQPVADALGGNSNGKHFSSWMLPLMSIIGASAFFGTERIESRRNKNKTSNKQ